MTQFTEDDDGDGCPDCEMEPCQCDELVDREEYFGVFDAGND